MFVNVLCYCALSEHLWKGFYLVLHSNIDIHRSAFSNFPQKCIEANKIRFRSNNRHIIPIQNYACLPDDIYKAITTPNYADSY